VRFGLFAINYNTCADPDAAVEVAQLAEEAGLASLWTGEHVVLPTDPSVRSPLPARAPMLDTICAATWIAAHTTTIRIGTGVIVLPLHHPVILAKQLASVDVVSGGRLTVGVAGGYLEAEFDAVGVPIDERGARMDEYVAALTALWTMEAPQFRGRFVSFAGIDAHPRPIQRPAPPLVFGGGSYASFRRAVTMGAGWYGFGMDLDGTRQCIEALRAAEHRYRRPDHLGTVEVIVTPIDGHDVDTLRRYEELGVDHLVALPSPATTRDRHRPVPLDEIRRTIDTLAQLSPT